MDCCKADRLIMKFMDKAISEEEAHNLHEHVSVCESCRRDFIIYDEIINVLSETEWVAPPELFEKQVMERIRGIEPLSRKAANALDNLWCAVWGVFSILLGIGTLLTINRDAILEYMSQTPALTPFVSALDGLSRDIAILLGNVSAGFYSAMDYANLYLAPARAMLIVVLFVLVTVQFFIYKKDKVRI